MESALKSDLQAIRELHDKDVEATKNQDFSALRSLMDKECVLIPPGGKPVPGVEYLSAIADSSADSDDDAEILSLEQNWNEPHMFGDFAFESGSVRYALRQTDGAVLEEEQPLERLIKRQKDGSWLVFRAVWSEAHGISERD